jgi:hypothetical protein
MIKVRQPLQYSSNSTCEANLVPEEYWKAS